MSTTLWSRVTPQQTSSILESLRIVRKIISTESQFTSGAGLTTGEIYRLALRESPGDGFQRFTVVGAPGAGANANAEAGAADAGYMKSGGRKKFPPVPPNPGHPVRSMSFLKQQVLPILEGTKEIRLATAKRIPVLPETTTTSTSTTSKGVQTKANNNKNNKGKPNPNSHPFTSPTPSPITIRLWKPVQKPKNPPPLTQSQINWGPYAKSFKPRGFEVGMGADIGHLSRRRRRVREEKVKRDVVVLNRVRREEKFAENAVRWKEEREREEGRREKKRERVRKWVERVRELRARPALSVGA